MHKKYSEKKWSEFVNHYVELKDAVEEIAALIYYQSSLNDQDRWLEDIIVRGIWEIPEDGSE